MEISKIIIGLEVHIELKTDSKMFCGCSSDHFGKEPNTQTCPVCLGLPGALPVPNKKAIDWTILLGTALGGEISKNTHFDRKNYFYPDLPKGYQISQYEEPLVKNGQILLNDNKKIRLRRIHLEEDTGKLLHQKIGGKKFSLIDFNRSGVPLVEIVTEPNFYSADEAKEYLEKMQQLVRYLKISNADMEKGSMRCEPNINLEINDEGKLFYTPIVELKNINSFRFVQKAIDYEVERQFVAFKDKRVEKNQGNKETRGWNEEKKITVLQRAKEEANDYRYFPEPDIPPIEWSEEELVLFKAMIALYELPEKKEKRFQAAYSLSPYQAKILTADLEKAEYYEAAVMQANIMGVSPIDIANVIINKRAPDSLDPKNLAAFVYDSNKSTEISSADLEKKIKEVLEKYPEVIAGYHKSKKPQALGIIVGIIKKETGTIVSVEKIIEIIKATEK